MGQLVPFPFSRGPLAIAGAGGGMIGAGTIAMNFTDSARAVCTAVLALTFTAPAAADALTGSASLTGASMLVAKGCGRDRAAFSASLLVSDDGTWSAQATGEEIFAGTYTPAGRSGRKLAFTFDAASTAIFITSIGEDVTTLCESAPATVTSSRPKALTLTLNRKLTKAKLVVKYAFTGTAGGRTGTATYKLLGRGAWTPG